MATDAKMTAKEFEAIMPRLGRLTLDTIKVARSVLVDGLSLTGAGELHHTSRQRVYAIVKRFEAAVEEVPRGWKRVEVWLPPELADQVESMATKAKASQSTSGSSGASA